jgi:PAS domain S-box-containing protein
LGDDYRMLFASHPAPMWVYDLESLRFVEVNDAAVDSYGYSREEFLSMTVGDIWSPEDGSSALQGIAAPGAGDRSERVRHRHKDGRAIEAEITARVIKFEDRPARLVMAQDVTERRRLEQRAERVERLDSIGKLAGGVAHDFNNLLSVIINYAGFVREAVRGEADGSAAGIWRSVDEDTEQIERAAARATALTQQLRAFARKEAIRPEVISVNQVVLEVEQLLRRSLTAKIELVTSLVKEPRTVLMDPSKLEEVITNLALNARDAMPEGGTLTIATENIDLDPAAAASLPGIHPGAFIRVAVSDTGSGMSEEVQLHAFEPFFSTKPSSEGTGLGLATAYGIVVQAGGEINVDSTLMVGTTFSVLLPAHSGPITDPAP